ncbi:serine hydrolase [Perlabentimonas gracilis]|uniref:serine hydrolase n=1 Tax=Perlabentimonas gracilis TaxID=2715279 RepID=UPI001408152D|nr:serine hydrolase [Perlabentimonas gracilis]NHB67168.1 serine hydrolase [Perlabentimonas gracilis]
MKNLILTIALVKMMLAFSATSGVAQVENLQSKIDSLMITQLSEDLPGGAIAVLSSSGVIYKNSFGIMDVEQNLKIDENTLFDLASVAKQFTAYAIMLLEQEGKIDLDEDIRTYLGDLPDYEHRITVRHLLQHTSGIASTDWLRIMIGSSFDEVWSHNDEIKLLKQYSQLNFKPNTQHVYSNGGYSFLASIVEEVSGMSFADFMNQRIFKPLGMETALVNARPDLRLVNDAIGYEIVEGKPVKVSSTTDYSYGSGNVWANLSDMIKWGQNFLSPKVGNAEMINRIFSKYNTLDNGDSISYTYGFFVREHKGIKLVMHQGGVPGFRNYLMIFPNDNLVITAHFNNENINAWGIVNGIADIVLSNKIEEKPAKPRIEVALNVEKAKQFAGTYELADGMELTFKVEQDTFWLVLPDDDKFQLFAEDDYNFFLKAFNAQCTFVKTEDNKVNQMVWHQRKNSHNGTRVGERIALGEDDIMLFAGHYIQSDLNIEYPVTFENGTLYVQTPSTFMKYFRVDRMELKHVSGDRFHNSIFGILEFTRNKEGKVNGFVMPELGRLQNVRFDLM